MAYAQLVIAAVAFMVPCLPGAEDACELVSLLKNYRQALADGKPEEAASLTASFPKLPNKVIVAKAEQYSKMMRAGRLKLWIFPSSAKREGDCGVVIIGDDVGQPDVDDPAYLIKQDGK